MSYDNPTYWRELHEDMPGGLRAVGYPALSERFNELKYASEARTFAAQLDRHLGSRPAGSTLRVLDLGAGSGYWTRLVDRWARQRGLIPSITAVDLSGTALAQIHAALPEVRTVQGDLCTMDPGELAGGFDLVYACYVLHHLPRLAGFVHALRLACGGVAPGGVMMVMDPVLTMPYSTLDCHDFYTYHGNGVVRNLMTIEDVVQSAGLTRLDVTPAVSFVLNGPIQGAGPWRFALARRAWFALHRVYRSQVRTSRWAKRLDALDQRLKGSSWSMSSSLCVYTRPEGGAA